MRGKLITTLKLTNNTTDVIDFIAAVNELTNLEAEVLPKSNSHNHIEVNIYDADKPNKTIN